MPTPQPRPWPANCVERWPIERLAAYANNARLHSADDVKAVARSIEKFGFTNPVLVAEGGTIIAGHCRVEAAKKLGLKEVPVMVARGWSQAEIRAYCVADNQLAARATWDYDTLRGELSALKDLDFDIDALGFDPIALAELMAPAGKVLADPEAAPEPPANPVSHLGDLWLLGPHRVLCGDSTNAANVAKALGEYRPQLMVTDPPYGVAYDPSWRNKAAGKGARSTGKVLNDDRADWREAWALFPGAVAYVWHAGLYGGVVGESLIAYGFELRSQIIWVKSNFTLGRSDYHWRHETCLYAVRKGAKSRWASDRKQSTVWEIPNNDGTNAAREKTWGHGTQKPLEVMRRPIEHNSKPGDVVYDAFLGSGTTLIAAELTGRICVGLELSPAYVDVIVRRWQEVTGKSATLQENGKVFEELARDRGVEISDVP